MAQKLYEESNIQAIADAIRAKNGETTKYKPSEMASAIDAITTGGGNGLTFDILHTVDITEPIKAIQFDWDSRWNEYTFFFVVPENLEMSAKEWLCFKLWRKGGGEIITSHYIGTGGGGGGVITFTGEHATLVLTIFNGNGYNFRKDIMGKNGSVEDFGYIIFAPYYAQNTMNSGKIHIYGGK